MAEVSPMKKVPHTNLHIILAEVSPMKKARKSAQFLYKAFSRTFQVRDVRAENGGRPHQSLFSCGPGDGEILFDPWASGRKGQEPPPNIQTEKFMLHPATTS